MEEADIRQDGHLTEALAQASILVVDDEPGMRNFLVKTLAPHCRTVVEAANTDEAAAQLSARHFDIMLLDNVMPGRKGLDWLAEQNTKGGVTDVIMVTAYADLETAIAAMRAGASDFLLKPFRSNQLLNALRRCQQTAMLRRENRLLRHELDQSDLGRRQRNRLLGTSPEISAIRDTLDRVKDVDTPLLITGPSGSGKEVAARHLHAASARARHPFVPINCATIPSDMIEVELYGHAAGIHPGATTAREGLLVSAQGVLSSSTRSRNWTRLRNRPCCGFWRMGWYDQWAPSAACNWTRVSFWPHRNHSNRRSPRAVFVLICSFA